MKSSNLRIPVSEPSCPGSWTLAQASASWVIIAVLSFYPSLPLLQKTVIHSKLIPSLLPNVMGHTGRFTLSWSTGACTRITRTSPSGYVHLGPRNPLGKIATMLYGRVGIPVMWFYMANIGGFMVTSFNYFYSRLCR